MITMESKVKQIYENPIGRDMMEQIFQQMGKDATVLKNPFIQGLKLKTVKKLAKSMIADDFYETFLAMINLSEERYPTSNKHKETRSWWKESVFYQIYPRSFCDSNGDGIGDLPGIISKLDYLKDLGVNCLWLSPIYDSPNDDNGYDIRDYQKIMAEFGTMEDFDRLLNNVHRRGMRLIMDLVVNHTSDEHAWFKKAIQDPTSKEHGYYIFRKGTPNQPPNNWTSFFSGPAWNYYEELGEWGLHLFSKKQMDLNWDNPELRKEITGMISWWMEKGVDGFRMDVGNLISKQEGLPDGNQMVAEMIGICGIENYVYGPNLHTYMKEIHKDGIKNPEKFLVGETPGVGIEMAKLLTAQDRNEMNMIFNFDHLENPGHGRFEEYEYDLNEYKKYIMKWMHRYSPYARMSLFFDNHDNPRMLSKICKDPKYREVLAKLLCMMQMTLKGTPFIYQGQEIACVNVNFTSMGQIKDVESINLYQELIQTMSHEEAFQKILSGTRDHARVIMPWNDEKYAGFSEYEPWILGDDDYKEYNVMNQICTMDSTIHFYKKMLDIRSDSLVLKYGNISFVGERKNDFLGYFRTPALDEKSCKNKGTYYIECNLGSTNLKRKQVKGKKKCILSNYENRDSKMMHPYEANLYIML